MGPHWHTCLLVIQGIEQVSRSMAILHDPVVADWSEAMARPYPMRALRTAGSIVQIPASQAHTILLTLDHGSLFMLLPSCTLGAPLF